MTNPTATLTAPVTDTVAAEQDTQEPIRDLGPADRCDANAGEIAHDGTIAAEQAYVRIVVPTPAGDRYLDFCGHHFAEHEAAIVTAGYRTLDRRERLAARADKDEVY